MKSIKQAGDQPAGIYTLTNRWKHMVLLCLAAMCIPLSISACDFRKVDASAETNSKKEGNMEFIQNNTTVQNKIPLIDAAVLPETETATFALG